MPESASKKARAPEGAANPGDVAGQLVRAGGIAVARGDDGHFVDFAERLGERRAQPSGSPVNQLCR